MISDYNMFEVKLKKAIRSWCKKFRLRNWKFLTDNLSKLIKEQEWLTITFVWFAAMTNLFRWSLLNDMNKSFLKAISVSLINNFKHKNKIN
jgi:hypothetical protein